MDQDSASGGKSSWRDRLGIPKDEAEGNAGEAARRLAPEAPRMAPRAPLPPAAPMTQGTSRPPGFTPAAPLQPARPAPLSGRTEAGAMAPAARSAASEGLAERLRLQRESAERMAEQRLALARQRAAARVQEAQIPTAPRIAAPAETDHGTATPPATPPAMPPATPPAMPAASAPAPVPAASAQPRFSFAEEVNRAKRAPIAPARPASLPPQRTSTAPLAPPAPGSRPEPRLEGLRSSPAPIAPRPPLRPRIDEDRAIRPFNSDLQQDFEEGYLEPSGTYSEPRTQPMRPPLALTSIPRGNKAASDDEAYFTAERVAGLDRETTTRKGPLLLLGSLLGVIVLFAIGIFLWQQMPSDTATAPSDAEIPLVSAPAEPIKMEPSVETSGDETTPSEVTGKKQIYDRILGDEEQGGVPENIVPSEEAPVPQGAATDSLATTPDTPSIAEPPAAEPPSDDLLPIPAEPETPGPNGSLDVEAPETMASALPVPAETQMAAAEPAAPAEVEATQALPETPAEAIAETPAETTAETPAVEIPGLDVATPPAPGPVSLVVTPRPKPKQLAAKPVAPALPPAAPSTEQVASVDAAAPVPTATAYVAQLSSLNTEADAKAEFSRVRSAHSAIVGSLTPVITPADLGTTGTIFRLALGPLASKEAASKLCAQLIAAGEKDCIVRRQ